MKRIAQTLGLAGQGPIGFLMVFSAILALNPVSSALSQDWTTEASLDSSVSHETNPTRNAVSQRPNSELILTPNVITTYETERSTLEIQGELEVIRSRDQVVRGDVLNYNGSLSGTRSFVTTELDAAAAWSAVEFENSGFDDDELLSTGGASQTSEDRSVESFGFDFSLNHALSDNNSIFGDLTLDETNFSGDSGVDFVDTGTVIGYRQTIDENTSLSSQVGYRNFSPEDSSEVNTFDIQLGGEYEFSALSSLSLLSGVRHSNDEVGFEVDITYATEFEKSSLSLNVFKNLEPSSEGELRDTQGLSTSFRDELDDRTILTLGGSYVDNEDRQAVRIDAGLGHQVSDRLSIGIDLDVIENTSSGGQQESVNTEYAVNPSVSFVITEEMNASARYTEVIEDPGVGDLINSRRILVSVQYNNFLFE